MRAKAAAAAVVLAVVKPALRAVVLEVAKPGLQAEALAEGLAVVKPSLRAEGPAVAKPGLQAEVRLEANQAPLKTAAAQVGSRSLARWRAFSCVVDDRGHRLRLAWADPRSSHTIDSRR